MRGAAGIIVLLLLALPAAADVAAKLVALEKPVSAAGIVVTDLEGKEIALEEKQGKVLLINLWSKGCVPCKKEMPDLARLQKDLGGDGFEVVALTMEKRSAKSAGKILESWGAGNLAAYGNDPQVLARALYDAGMFTETKISFVYPTTYLVNKAGEIVTSCEGYFEWDTPEARAVITELMGD